MIPNMYKIAGELMPTVFHVSARAVATHALSIFGDHSDVNAVRETGFSLLASASVQEVMDLALVAHLASVRLSLPFVHFFDGFRTSMEIQKIEMIDYDEMAKLLDYEALDDFRSRCMNPEYPQLRGTSQNPDIFFQSKEAANPLLCQDPPRGSGRDAKGGRADRQALQSFRLCRRPGGGPGHHLHGLELRRDRGDRELPQRTWRESGPDQSAALPSFFRGALSESPPLLGQAEWLCWTEPSLRAPWENPSTGTCARFSRTGADGPMLVGGRYGLGSKDFTPVMVKAVFDNLRGSAPKNHFTVGITDDVSHTSLELGADIDAAPKGTVRCKFWGLGADGTVGANKNAIKIIGENTDMFAQAYFAYDAKKSGGITMSHLRFSPHRIQSPYLLTHSDFIACHNPAFVTQYDILDGIREGGAFLLNSPWTPEDMERKLPNRLKRTIAQKKLKFYNIDAVKIATDLGLGGRINMIMQAAFFQIANVIPPEEAFRHMKEAIQKTYGKKGEEVVKMNEAAVDGAVGALQKIDLSCLLGHGRPRSLQRKG